MEHQAVKKADVTFARRRCNLRVSMFNGNNATGVRYAKYKIYD